MPRVRFTRKYRRGLSEIIGGLIALSVILIAFLAVVNAFQESSISSVSYYGLRSRFEQERSAEKIMAVLNDNVCELVNVGSVRVEIIRTWSDGSVINLSDPIVLEPKEKININYIAGGEADYVVTSRGNVFPAKYACEKQRQENQEGGQYINSNNTLGDLNYLDPERIMNAGIVASINGVRYYVAYYYAPGEQWYVNNGTAWEETVLAIDPDLDENNVSELIVVDSLNNPDEVDLSTGGWGGGPGGGVGSRIEDFNMTFLNIIRIDENVDTIIIHFKLIAVISGSWAPKDVTFTVYAGLIGENEAWTTASSTAAPPLKTGNTVVIIGDAIFPIKAFSAFNSTLTPGTYNVTLYVDVDYSRGGRVVVERMRVETISITGAEIIWSPKTP